MHICSPHKTGIIGAGLLAGFHFIWALMVAIGIAQPIMDWILSLHMISLSYSVGPFNIVSAIMLLIFTGAVGYATGYLLGYLFAHCKGCMGGSCCMDDECMMPEHDHMMMEVMPAKKKAPAKKAAPKAKAKAKKKKSSR